MYKLFNKNRFKNIVFNSSYMTFDSHLYKCLFYTKNNF